MEYCRYQTYNIYSSLGDDLDITVRYGDVGNYAWNNYSVIGKMLVIEVMLQVLQSIQMLMKKTGIKILQMLNAKTFVITNSV